MTVLVSAVAVAVLAVIFGLLQRKGMGGTDCAACRRSESADCDKCSGNFDLTESHDV